jgi:hypothetical protein
MNPMLIFIFASLTGFGLAVAGVYVLLGLGWALLAAAASLLFISGFLRKGLTSD